MGVPTPWSRFFMPQQYAPSVTGAPIPGARLYFFSSGTATPLDTFSEPTLSIPNANPVVANAGGLFGAIFLQQQLYKVMLTDANGDEIWTEDPVAPFIPTDVEAQKFVVAQCTVDGGGGIPLVGICGDDYIPVGCTLTTAVLQSTLPGSLQLDVWINDFEVNNPPTISDSIVASDPPTLSSSQSSIDTVLTGWAKAVNAGSAVRYSITSIDDVITRFTLSLIGTIP